MISDFEQKCHRLYHKVKGYDKIMKIILFKSEVLLSVKVNYFPTLENTRSGKIT